jgi:hypothetical protein
MKYLTKLLHSAARRVPGFAIAAVVVLRVVLGFAVLAGCSDEVAAQRPVEAPHSGLIKSSAAAFNAATEKSYIVDSDGRSVEVSEDRTGATRSVKVGSHPVSVAVNSHNGRAIRRTAGPMS